MIVVKDENSFYLMCLNIGMFMISSQKVKGNSLRIEKVNPDTLTLPSKGRFFMLHSLRNNNYGARLKVTFIVY